MSTFDPAARAEFTHRFEHFDGYRSEARQDDLFTVFKSGMQYASTQEPTDAEVEAATLSILADEGGFDLSDEDDAYHIYEIQWKDMDEGEMSGRLASARAALSAAAQQRKTR